MISHPGNHEGARLVQNIWTESIMDASIHKLQSVLGSTIRGIAKEYGLSECTAQFRLNKINKRKRLEKK